MTIKNKLEFNKLMTEFDGIVLQYVWIENKTIEEVQELNTKFIQARDELVNFTNANIHNRSAN